MVMGFDVKQVQNRLLEMAVIIANILEHHDIPYEIAFGTLLGAVRHGGFIPWDDDFDFFLFADTYDRAVAILRQELPAAMFLEDAQSEPNFFHGWARVKDLGTKCTFEHYPQDDSYSHKGLTVDLFRLTPMAAADFPQYRFNEGLAYLERRRRLNNISAAEYNKRLEALEARKSRDELSPGRQILAYPFDIGHQDLAAVFPLKRYSFENKQFWGPQKPEVILRERYGDYLTLPPEEQRIPHFSEVIFL